MNPKDSAFPSLEELERWDDYRGEYLPNGYGPKGGLSKRELFAAMMAQSIFGKSWPADQYAHLVAHDAVLQADALLAELSKDQK